MAYSEEKTHPLAITANPQVEVVFTQKQKIILLLELQKYREKYGEKMRWKSFHKASRLRDQYSHTQISQQCRTLEELYMTNARRSPSGDIRDCRIFNLSNSLWGERERERRDPCLSNPEDFGKLREFLSEDVEMPEIVKRLWVVMGKENAFRFEQKVAQLRRKQLVLSNQNLILKRQICELMMDVLPPYLSAAQQTGEELECKKA